MAIVRDLDEKLKPLYLSDLQSEGALGKRDAEVAAGSYGFVYEVKVKGIVRIAKKPHTFFLKKASQVEKDRVITCFKQECILLSKLRHPNIVQFIGVHYEKENKEDIVLVMEKLQYDLADYLDSNKGKVALNIKMSILQEVSFGLVYLHESNPPIIHRDLTARNILLTSLLKAKIADVGVAKLMDPVTMAAISHTSVPGQQNYMPPEALKEKAKYTLKLDIFSFGHLCLHTLIEDYPKVYTITNTPAIQQEGITEKLKRQRSLDLIGEDHELHPVIVQCLNDYPDRRPSSRALNELLNFHMDKLTLDDAEQQTQFYLNEWETSQHLLEKERQSYEQKLQTSQNMLKRQRQSSEQQIRLLTDQIEDMRTEYEEKLQETTEKLQTEHEEKLQVLIDQMEKEADIERRKHKAEALKETNRLTEQLQASKDDFHSQLEGAETAYRELQRDNDKLEAEINKMRREFVQLEEKYHKIERNCYEPEQESLKIQTEMALKNSTLESEKQAITTKYQELIKHNENVQATMGKLRSENQALVSGNRELEHQFHEVLDQYAKEKQRISKQLQNIDGVRKVLKTQLDTEVQRAEEASKIAEESRSEVTALSRELDTKDQINCQLQRELKLTQDRLSEMEFKNAQIESEMKKMTIQNVRLERERNILHSPRIDGDGQSEVNRQLIAERDIYEAKYSKLLDDYRMVQQLAIRHGLRIPNRRDEASPCANPPPSSDSDVRPFDQDVYRMHPPVQDNSRRSHASYVSGLGPMYHGQQQLLASNQGSRSPGSRNPQSSNDPSNIIHENELAQRIDHDIAEAAAHMEKEIHTTMVSMTDARPLDSNLICPLCGKQFRIGQIQHYRQHVDNCSKNPV